MFLMQTPAKLYLIPTTIAEDTENKVIPLYIKKEIAPLKHFLAENIRTARRYLSSLQCFESIEILQFGVLDKKVNPGSIDGLMDPLKRGYSMGLLSESGCPGIADPGAVAVAWAHKHNIQVVPLVGPSSIFLALMGSGLNGQHFAFRGYLPIKNPELSTTLKRLEKLSLKEQQTQIFIETPYRNNQLLKNLSQILHPTTLLCVAIDLTSHAEMIKTQPIQAWKKETITLPKSPAIFLFLAGK